MPVPVKTGDSVYLSIMHFLSSNNCGHTYCLVSLARPAVTKKGLASETTHYLCQSIMARRQALSEILYQII